jgi:hypothetical protein
MSLNPWRPARRGPWWLLTLGGVALMHGLVGLILMAWLERPPAVTPGQSVAVDILPLPPEALARQQAQAEAEAKLMPVPEMAPLPIPELPPQQAAPDAAPPAGGLQAQELRTVRGTLPLGSQLCSTRALPNVAALPLVAGAEAEISVQGTVRGGRVVAVKVLEVRGVSDASAQRLLGAAVEAAMRSGWRCASDGVFEQGYLLQNS